MNGDKILIILDDVWEKLNLGELCIPCGSNYMNCKILLTSRSEKVCQKMNAQSKICVNSLSTPEAMILFKRVVGERFETDPNLEQVALKVVEECGGLPLLIQALGNALKDESIESWNSALNQLQKHAPSDIDEEIRKSFTHLKLSYDYLKSEEAKSCFLLCGMFPEDYDISLEDLVRYEVGLGKFDDLDSIEDARNKVQNAVNILISSGLLLNSKEKGCTKMHDVVRDVALLISSQGNNKFLVKARHGLTEWLPRNRSFESYMGISLVHIDIIKLPCYKVNVPHLEIFLLQGNHDLSMVHDDFIGCMKNLKVLNISWTNISFLRQSFELLTNLRTLDISRNKSLRDISILGELKDLEILLLNKTRITKIPTNIVHLVNLRVLQVNNCVSLFRISPGVISKLQSLEELWIDLRYMRKGVNGCIVEVMMLSKLTYLDLRVRSINHIPKGFNSENLKGFVILVGDYIQLKERPSSYRYLSILKKHLAIPLLKWLNKVIEVSHRIDLSGVDNLNNIVPTLYDERFNKSERIGLYECYNMSCLVDDGIRCDGDEGKTEEKFFKQLKHLELYKLFKLKVLWKCPDRYVSVTNLVTLSMTTCIKLKRVFTLSVAQRLVNLKKLHIEYCIGLEEVIWGEDGGGGDDESGKVIVFPSLATISFQRLHRLKRFVNSSGNCSIKYPSLVEVEIDDCESMKIWGRGIHETPNLKTLVMNDNVPIVVDGPFANK